MAGLLLIASLFIPIALIFPGWRGARRLRHESIAVLLLPLVGAALWLVLGTVIAILDISGGSLSNLVIELCAVGAFTVPLAYAKFLLINPSRRFQDHSMSITLATLATFVVSLRMLMPVLGE